MTPIRSLALAILVLAAGVAWVFWPVQDHGFVDFDDLVYVVHNPHLREPLDAGWLVHNFTQVHQAYWIPLTWLSYRLDVAASGLHAPAMLRTNVLLHLASTLLLYLAFLRFTGARWRSLFVAAVFAVHPLHVESVAWVTERKDVLSTFFWILGMLLYGTLHRGWRRDVGVGGCLLLGLLAKPLLVTFPFALVLLDIWPLRRWEPEHGWRGLASRLGEKLPLIGLAGAAALIVMQSQRDMSGMDFSAGFPWSLRIMHAVDSLATYLGLAFWPRDLSPFVPHPMSAPSVPRVAWASVVLVVPTAFSLWQLRRRPWLFAGWAWFVGNLIPVLGLVGVGMQARADRWMYVPLVGLAWIVVWSAVELVERWPRGRVAVAGGLGLLLVMATGVARQQVGIWCDTGTLFTHAVSIDADNWYAHHRLAVMHRQAGRFEAAEEHYLRTIELMPRFAYPQGELGDVYLDAGWAERADVLHANAPRTGWDDAFAEGRLGIALVRMGLDARAVPLLESALARDPEAGDLHAALALARARGGEVLGARRHAERAIRNAPATTDGRVLLAWLLATAPEGELRDPATAHRALEPFDPDDPDLRPDLLDALAAVAAAEGDPTRAFALARRGAQRAREWGWTRRAEAMEDRARRYLQGRAWFESRRGPST